MQTDDTSLQHVSDTLFSAFRRAAFRRIEGGSFKVRGAREDGAGHLASNRATYARMCEAALSCRVGARSTRATRVCAHGLRVPYQGVKDAATSADLEPLLHALSHVAKHSPSRVMRAILDWHNSILQCGPQQPSRCAKSLCA